MDIHTRPQLASTSKSDRSSKSAAVVAQNERWIPGGVVSLNRKVDPNLCFTRGKGSRVWDIDGNEYIDYQAAFSAVFLGHNDEDVNEAVALALRDDRVLMGAGPTDREGELAELICGRVPGVEKLQITNTGSEATYHALRIARAYTGRDDLIIIQGGYNGWHNDVAGNVISDLRSVGPRVSPGEYPFDPISAGIPVSHQRHVHIVNFNDLDSIRYVAARYPISCVMLEPILQNIGVVKPQPGYLEGLRALADELGFLLIFDEVKTGFRHAFGGYQSLCGVTPDLCTFGKAVANGYPIGIIGGRTRFMDYFTHPEREKRVLIAGTYNAHPIPVAAAIATLHKLLSPRHDVYTHIENLGRSLQLGLNDILRRSGRAFHVARQGSALCVYFMDHAPVDFHDLARCNDAAFDRKWRLALIEKGIYQFPLSSKQASLSFAHSEEDIALTLEKVEEVMMSPALTA
ncbi:MAG TPA: aspartate aminotransferase family protein [Opitutaceae bacterium]|nr:aspartate aminotransferase family protein [Opitutaceae bacterium]